MLPKLKRIGGWVCLSWRYALCRQRLHVLKRMVVKLEAQLEGEKYRNQDREDQIGTAFIRAMGLYPPESRSTPARPMQPLRRQAAKSPVTAETDWDHLTESELAEWSIWKEDAAAAGVAIPKAKAEFLEQLRFRKSQEM